MICFFLSLGHSLMVGVSRIVKKLALECQLAVIVSS